MSDDLSIPNPGYRGNRAGRYGTGLGRVRRMDPDTHRLVMFAGGLAVVLAALIGASALVGRRSTEVPLVVADSRPIRVKPENPGGMKIDGAENDVFSSGSDIANSKLAAASENPDAKALRVPSAAPPPAIESLVPGIAPPQPTKPEIVASVPVANPDVAASPTAGKPALAANAPAAKPDIAASSAAKSALVANAPAKTAIVASLPARPAPVVSAKPQVAAAEAHASAAGHEAMVQLAALTSEDAARAEWQQLSKRMPDLLNGRQPVFSRADRDGHTFWRVRTAGFADLAQARAFCDHVREKGSGCSVADF